MKNDVDKLHQTPDPGFMPGKQVNPGAYPNTNIPRSPDTIWMTKKSLSSEFRDPDKADRLDELVQYLENFDSLPETQVFKEHSYQYLGLQKGSVMLDAGCGPGYDSLRMAARVGSSGTSWELI